MSKAVPVALSLMKPASTLTSATQRARRLRWTAETRIARKRRNGAESRRLRLTARHHVCHSRRNGGESGIRTHGRLPYTRFPSVRLKPLGHLSCVHRAPPTSRMGETGGEGGIRTHDRFPYTPLAGARLQPLGHLSARPHNIPISRRVSAPCAQFPPWDSGRRHEPSGALHPPRLGSLGCLAPSLRRIPRKG